MGSSGAGKSSLLDLLAGRVRTGKRGGEVMINGQKEGFKLKHIASYVMQDDALHAALTVCHRVCVCVCVCVCVGGGDRAHHGRHEQKRG
jgi:ABC-type multidrug transport system ATPase subunit